MICAYDYNKEIYFFSGFQEVSLACTYMHRCMVAMPLYSCTALNSCSIKQVLITDSSFLIPLGFICHIHASTFKVRPLFQANNARTFQGLSRTFFRNGKNFFYDNLPHTDKNVVLNHTGLALWHSAKPHFIAYRNLQKTRARKTSVNQALAVHL